MQAAISRYRLLPNDNPVLYTCIHSFTNAARNHYYFKDKTGDVFQWTPYSSSIIS